MNVNLCGGTAAGEEIRRFARQNSWHHLKQMESASLNWKNLAPVTKRFVTQGFSCVPPKFLSSITGYYSCQSRL